MKNSMPGLKPENITGEDFFINDALVEQLFRTFYASLCRTINRLVNDRDTAKDIVQEVFLKLWQNREKLDPGKSLKSYLYRSAINTALNHLERSKRVTRLDEDKIDPAAISSRSTEEQHDANELEEKIKHAIEKLPPGCRAVFVMSRYECMSYKEIAEYMQISPKTVENQMGKSLALMKDYLSIYLKVLVVYISLAKIFFPRAWG